MGFNWVDVRICVSITSTVSRQFTNSGEINVILALITLGEVSILLLQKERKGNAMKNKSSDLLQTNDSPSVASLVQ